MDAVPHGIFDIRQILNQHPDTAAPLHMTSDTREVHRYPISDDSSPPPPSHRLSHLQRANSVRLRRRPKRSKSEPMSMTDSDEECRASSGAPWQRGSLNSTTSSTSSSFNTNSSASSSSDGNLAEACCDHVAVLADELPFASGDVITVLDSSSTSGLWFGMFRDIQGWFPSNYVRMLSREGKSGEGSSHFSSSPSSSTFTSAMRRQRANAVHELVKTERDYVQLLDNIVYGFVHQTRRRSDLFPLKTVETLFSNLEQLLSLHSRLLRHLELSLDSAKPEFSLVGGAFLRHKLSFPIYAEYCNNRPVSCAELAHLSKQTVYQQFFEACRLLRGLPRLSLEAFLLSPVQRICRYPLQLSQLLKVTPEDHGDHSALVAAIRLMREVAQQLDERRRRIESLQNIVLFQKSLQAFRGPDLLEKNSIIIRSGEAMCRCVAGGQHWAKQVTLFLLDQTLLLCKRDVFSRSGFIFKERISLSSVAFYDVPDGKDSTFHVSVKNAFRLVGENRQYLFSCQDATTKKDWMSSFQERKSLPAPATMDEKRIALETLKSNMQIS